MAKKPDNKKKTREVAPAIEEGADVEEVKTGGLGFEDGLVLTTTLLIVLALVLVFFAYQKYSQ